MLPGHGSDVWNLVLAIKAVSCTEKDIGTDDYSTAKVLVLLVSTLERDLIGKVSVGHISGCVDDLGCCTGQRINISSEYCICKCDWELIVTCSMSVPLAAIFVKIADIIVIVLEIAELSSYCSWNFINYL